MHNQTLLIVSIVVVALLIPFLWKDKMTSRREKTIMTLCLTGLVVIQALRPIFNYGGWVGPLYQTLMVGWYVVTRRQERKRGKPE